MSKCSSGTSMSIPQAQQDVPGGVFEPRDQRPAGVVVRYNPRWPRRRIFEIGLKRSASILTNSRFDPLGPSYDSRFSRMVAGDSNIHEFTGHESRTRHFVLVEFSARSASNTRRIDLSMKK